ncbi:MAG TPA: hypothetical protein VMU43_14615 [Candidatus Acidoferrum sp.]|nr:hypothetical protein [Candidatus Acidoferrum sp.]
MLPRKSGGFATTRNLGAGTADTSNKRIPENVKRVNQPPSKVWSVAAIFCVLIFARPLAAKALKKIGVISFPGPSGREFGSLTVDSEDHLLFCAHSGAGDLYVVDLQKGQLVQIIRDLPGVRSATYAADARKIYASVSGEDSIGVIDAATFRVEKEIPTEAGPSAMAYAAPFHRLFVSDETAHAEAVVDVASDAVVKMIQFDGRAGTPDFDPVSKTVYVNLPDTNQIAAIDPATNAVTARYSAGRCAGNSGLAIDAERRVAFLSCEGNNLLAVFDLRSKAVVAYLPMAAGGAEVALDPALGRIYVACVSGAISVYEAKKTEQWRKVGDVSAAHAVHSLAIDSSTHRIFVPEMEDEGMPVAQLAVYEERP